MRLFSSKNRKHEPFEEVRPPRDRRLRRLAESDMREVFCLELMKSEFAVGNVRIDMLAFDGEAKSFAIVEYRKDGNSGAVDQGYAYLSLLLKDNKNADFVLEYDGAKTDGAPSGARRWTDLSRRSSRREKGIGCQVANVAM